MNQMKLRKQKPSFYCDQKYSCPTYQKAISSVHYRDFNAAGHDVCSLKFQGILLQREAFWIHKLKTESPKGLTEELIFNCFLI